MLIGRLVGHLTRNKRSLIFSFLAQSWKRWKMWVFIFLLHCITRIMKVINYRLAFFEKRKTSRREIWEILYKSCYHKNCRGAKEEWIIICAVILFHLSKLSVILHSTRKLLISVFRVVKLLFKKLLYRMNELGDKLYLNRSTDEREANMFVLTRMLYWEGNPFCVVNR